MDIPDTATLVKILKIQNESLLALLHMHWMIPEVDGYRTQSRDITRVGNDLRKVQEELQALE